MDIDAVSKDTKLIYDDRKRNGMEQDVELRYTGGMASATNQNVHQFLSYADDNNNNNDDVDDEADSSRVGQEELNPFPHIQQAQY